MQEYSIVVNNNGTVEVHGIPDAAKVIAIDGPKVKRLADLVLHRSDLQFAKDCLESIQLNINLSHTIQEALWRSAIVHFIKCFGNGERFQMDAHSVYKRHTGALVAFNYFKDLRNKHIIHDENSYAQSIPGAVLNHGNKSYSVERITCLDTLAMTLEQGNFSNLAQLIQIAHNWVESDYNKQEALVIDELEKEGYDNLIRRGPPVFTVPTVDEISKPRAF